MSEVRVYLLRAKHWQIFLVFTLLFGLSCFFLFGLRNGLYGFFALTLIFEVILFGWFWSIGSLLNSQAEPRLRLSEKFFRFATVYPPSYLPLLFIFFVKVDYSPALFLAIFPMHLFAMYCTFYAMYFVAKTITQAETCRTASFGDYVAIFLLLWFFPVGIWIVQPTVNRLFAEGRNTEPLPSIR